jgi:hypothetical protein
LIAVFGIGQTELIILAVLAFCGLAVSAIVGLVVLVIVKK